MIQYTTCPSNRANRLNLLKRANRGAVAACFAPVPAWRPALVKLLALALALALFGCAAKTPTGAESEARLAWTAFRASADVPGKPFLVQASLNFSAPGKSHRVLLKLWGELGYPLRLDFSAGMGQTFAMWREDASGWLAYYPMDATAYTHADTRKGAAMLGMPLPLNVRELAAVLCGRLGQLVPANYRAVKPKPGGLEYTLEADPRLASVTLDPAGRVLALTGKGIDPWRVEFADYDDDAATAATAGNPGKLARTITLTTPGGLKGILRIKKYEPRDEPWPAAALSLPLPEATVVYDLARLASFKKPDLNVVE